MRGRAWARGWDRRASWAGRRRERRAWETRCRPLTRLTPWEGPGRPRAALRLAPRGRAPLHPGRAPPPQPPAASAPSSAAAFGLGGRGTGQAEGLASPCPRSTRLPACSPSSSCIFRRSSAPTSDTRLGGPSAWGTRTSNSKYFCRSRKDSCSGDAVGPGVGGCRQRDLRPGGAAASRPGPSPEGQAAEEWQPPRTWAVVSWGGWRPGTAAKVL